MPGLTWRTPMIDEAAVEMLRVLIPLSPTERLDALALASKLACESDFLMGCPGSDAAHK